MDTTTRHPVAALQALLLDELLRSGDGLCRRLQAAERVRSAAQALDGGGMSAEDDEAVSAWLAVTLGALESVAREKARARRAC